MVVTLEHARVFVPVVKIKNLTSPSFLYQQQQAFQHLPKFPFYVQIPRKLDCPPQNLLTASVTRPMSSSTPIQPRKNPIQSNPSIQFNSIHKGGRTASPFLYPSLPFIFHSDTCAFSRSSINTLLHLHSTRKQPSNTPEPDYARSCRQHPKNANWQTIHSHTHRRNTTVCALARRPVFTTHGLIARKTLLGFGALNVHSTSHTLPLSLHLILAELN